MHDGIVDALVGVDLQSLDFLHESVILKEEGDRVATGPAEVGVQLQEILKGFQQINEQAVVLVGKRVRDQCHNLPVVYL